MTTAAPRYINRELSWLEFNQRVLDEARNPGVALLERLKFLAITASNLDEFFMVRVGGLQMLCKEGSTKTDPAGMTPGEQMRAVSQRAHRMTDDQYAAYCDELEPSLAAAGLRRRSSDALTKRQFRVSEQVFDSEVYAVLSPMAVIREQDFPLLINRMLNICVRLEGNGDGDEQSTLPRGSRFAVIPLGRALNRFVTLPSEGGYDYMLLEDVIAMFIERFFPGEKVLECVPFRITRNADMSVREDMAADLLEAMEDILDARKLSDCIRLEIAGHATPVVLDFLTTILDIKEDDVYAVPGPLDLSAFMRLTDIKGFDALRNPSWPPQASPDVDPKTSLFDVLSRRDVLLVHPFDSFEPVVRLVEEAAADPDVLAIKQILYRTSRNSPIVAALKRAAQNGKHVTALVELKARFDEARNIGWAKDLDQADVQVIYGVKGLKTHAKVCIIVRREPHGIQRYVHFGTGNYNEITARLYSDVSLMTTNEELAADATSFLNAITGFSQPQKFRKIAAAPINLRERFIELIETETQRRRQGRPARIMAKMNSLADPAIIEALYAASEAGVRISLNVRGICCLRPGVPGLSENIEVVSIVDRFLEHSRIFYFYNNGDEDVFISSADWMPRNLDRRVELLTPVEDDKAKARLIDVLKTCLRDNVKGRVLRSDGSYHLRRPDEKKKPVRSQDVLYRAAQDVLKQAKQRNRTVFEPHRAPGAEV
jgi:polyphosphate kinase